MSEAAGSTGTAALTLRGAGDELEVTRVGEILVRSGYFPDIKSISQAAAKILAGQEVGLGPIAALKGVSFIKGVPSYSANTIAAAIKRHPRYDYRVLELTDQACVLRFTETGAAVGESSYTLADAQKAGLATTDNWRKYPRNMLFSRALTNGARWYCPDALGGQGIYTPDEMGDAVDAETGEIIDVAPAPISPEQTRAIHAASRRAGYSAEQYRARLQEMFGRSSSQELTQTQAQAAIAAFSTEAEPTAEERVAARRDAPTPEERSFYEKLNAAAEASGDAEPRFFRAPPPEAAATVTSEHDPLWQRWQQVCAEAVAWSVSPDDIPSLTLPIAQAALIECGQMLGGQIARLKLKSAREQLAARGRALELTAPQLDGLLEHHFGAGVTLATCTTEQAQRAAELLPDGALPAAEPQELPL